MLLTRLILLQLPPILMKAHKRKLIALTNPNWVADRWTTYKETTFFDAGERFKRLDFFDKGGFLEGSGGRKELEQDCEL